MKRLLLKWEQLELASKNPGKMVNRCGCMFDFNADTSGAIKTRENDEGDMIVTCGECGTEWVGGQTPRGSA